MKFRYDINGLRALAVIPVLLFHFNNNWIPGGFVGVDVFFVISGFLMTGIIFKEFDQKNFHLFSFYKSRANRIIPALTVLCLSLLVFGILILPPISYNDIAYHSLGALGGGANILYWKEAGYFDTASYDKWLLHTWSVSVEWQFYIIYPLILLYFKKRFTIDRIKVLLLVSTSISFILSLFASMEWPTSSYYLLPTRSWEMMIGGLAYAYPFVLNKNKKHAFEILGLSLIITSYIFASGKLSWPGIYALVPTLGTYLVIIANRQSSIITNNIVCQNIGKWSYTIYLWHWPVVVFFKKYTDGEDYVVWIFVAMSLGILAASIDNLKVNRIWYVLIFFITLVFSFYILKTDGISNRVEKKYQVNKQQFRNKHEGHLHLKGDNSWKEPVWINSASDNFEYIAYGDSHSRHYNSFFVNSQTKLASIAFDGCKSTRNTWGHFLKSSICKNNYKKLISLVKTYPGRALIISANLGIGKKRKESETDESYTPINEMKYLIEDVQDYVSSIYVIGQNQGSKIIPFEYLAESSLPFYRVFRDFDNLQLTQELRVIDKNELFKSKSKELGYIYIDPSPALCNKGKCFVIKNGKAIYTDRSHLTKFGAGIVGKYIMKKIKAREKQEIISRP